jgi:hypothetical protein
MRKTTKSPESEAPAILGNLLSRKELAEFRKITYDDIDNINNELKRMCKQVRFGRKTEVGKLFVYDNGEMKIALVFSIVNNGAKVKGELQNMQFKALFDEKHEILKMIKDGMSQIVWVCFGVEKKAISMMYLHDTKQKLDNFREAVKKKQP